MSISASRVEFEFPGVAQEVAIPNDSIDDCIDGSAQASSQASI